MARVDDGPCPLERRAIHWLRRKPAKRYFVVCLCSELCALTTDIAVKAGDAQITGTRGPQTTSLHRTSESHQESFVICAVIKAS